MAEQGTSLPGLLQRVLSEAQSRSSDRELLARFRENQDASAFATLLDRHGPMIHGVCRRLVRDIHLADDVFQATFLVLVRKARSIRRHDSVASWLYGVAQRLARQARLAQAAERRRAQRAAMARGKPSESNPAWDELLQVLDEELARLPERYRAPLVSCYLEGQTQDEAARQLGWSFSTLRRRLERGRELLKARLTRRGATLGAGLVAGLLAPSAAGAALSAQLRQAAVTAAVASLRGGAVPASVAVLVNGAMRMSTVAKLSLWLGAALVIGGTVAGAVWQAGREGQLPAAPAQGEARQPEARPPAAAPKTVEEPKQKEDIRPQVQALVQEALKALIEGKGRSSHREVAECAVLQAQIGDPEAARRTFGQAKEIIQSRAAIVQSQEWRLLARNYAEAGDVEEARKIIDTFTDPGPNPDVEVRYSHRGSVLRESALALAKAGKGKEALELAKSVTYYKPESVRLHVLHEIALYHARAGDLKEAQQTLDSIPDPSEKVTTLAGTVWATLGTFDIPGLPGIALIRDEAGDRDGARQALKQALEIAKGIKEPEKQTRARVAIVGAQAGSGDLAGALKTLEQIPVESTDYVFPLAAVARAQAAAGQGKAALEAIEKLSSPSQRVFALSQVIVGLGQAGDLKAARAIGEKALELAQTLADESEHHTALHVLASLQARAKDVEGALKTASRMKNQGVTYPNIAGEQAKAGDVKGALATVKEHLPERDWWHGKTLQGIALLQTERGEEKEALAWARELTSPTARGSALLGVAQGLLQRHQVGARRP